MVRDEFLNQIRRIKNAFGEKYYDIERVAIIWGHAKKLHFNDFAIICTTFIEGSRYAPLPKDFIEAINKAKNRKLQRRNKNEGFSGALNAIESRVRDRNKLRQFLINNYDGAVTLAEAVNVQRKRKKLN